MSTRTVVLVPLGPWVTVASSSPAPGTEAAVPAGSGWTVSTQDAARTATGRDLQLRLTALP